MVAGAPHDQDTEDMVLKYGIQQSTFAVFGQLATI